ncbi:MAG: protein kinase [Deltaproteobacteria bacterium]|jgi:serine/threonine protein kinase|nr:protein kinase [Deltaproteobacteria bacterium]
MASTLDNDPVINSKIGNYVIIKPLGDGAFGRVFYGEHPTIGRKIALKVLHDNFSDNQEIVQRFISEAKAVNKINHPNIIEVFDFGNLDDGRFYYIMEFVDGKELSLIIDEKAPVNLAYFDTLIKQIANALAAAHKHGIIHRDLKPDNIMVKNRDSGPFVKILDFGIAKLRSEDRKHMFKTKQGKIMGTPAYMAPEQARGENNNIGIETDVYSLGVIAYQLLTGHLPITGNSIAQLLSKIVMDTPAPPSQITRGLPREFDDVFRSALAKSRKMRNRSILDLYFNFKNITSNYDPHLRAEPLQTSNTQSSPGKFKPAGESQKTMGIASGFREKLNDKTPASEAQFKGYFKDSEERSVSRDLNTVSSSMELGVNDDELQKEQKNLEQRSLSSGLSLDLGEHQDPSSVENLRNKMKDNPQPDHADDTSQTKLEPDAKDLQDKETTTLDHKNQQFISLRKHKKSVYASFMSKFHNRFIAGMVISLLAGFLAAWLFSSNSLDRVTDLVSQKEIKRNTAVMLAENKEIEELEKQEKAARNNLAFKTAIVWVLGSCATMFVYLRYTPKS